MWVHRWTRPREMIWAQIILWYLLFLLFKKLTLSPPCYLTQAELHNLITIPSWILFHSFFLNKKCLWLDHVKLYLHRKGYSNIISCKTCRMKAQYVSSISMSWNSSVIQLEKKEIRWSTLQSDKKFSLIIFPQLSVRVHWLPSRFWPTVVLVVGRVSKTQRESKRDIDWPCE